MLLAACHSPDDNSSMEGGGVRVLALLVLGKAEGSRVVGEDDRIRHALELQLVTDGVDLSGHCQAAPEVALSDLPLGVGAPCVEMPGSSQASRMPAPKGQRGPAACSLDELGLCELSCTCDAKLAACVAPWQMRWLRSVIRLSNQKRLDERAHHRRRNSR